MSAAETISLLRAHCDANSKRERATFSIASIRELLDFVDDCAATIRPFPPLPSREVGGKASMSRELLGAVVDDVFDGAIEDPSVIEDIYASIKRHEGSETGLTLNALQAAHVSRQEEWCPDIKPDLSFRGNELGGECGEAQNVIKKLERERHGWRGSRDTVDHLGQELADVIHCATLVAITAGIDLEHFVVTKFNDTSAKNGLSTRLKHGGLDEHAK